MKRLFILSVVIFCFTGIYAQKQTGDLVLNPLMYQQFSQSQIDQYKQNNLAELIRLNYKMGNYACVAAKTMDGNTQTMGFPEQYANKGVVTNEDEIIRTGCVNPFLYSFPQDDYKINIFPLHHSGYYIMVIPKYLYEERVNAQLRQFGF